MTRALDVRRYAERRAARQCVKCSRPASARLCAQCWLVNRERLRVEKSSMKYGREQAREAR
jgi:hypothetical protein